jgi:hypothetical protein
MKLRELTPDTNIKGLKVKTNDGKVGYFLGYFPKGVWLADTAEMNGYKVLSLIEDMTTTLDWEVDPVEEVNLQATRKVRCGFNWQAEFKTSTDVTDMVTGEVHTFHNTIKKRVPVVDEEVITYTDLTTPIFSWDSPIPDKMPVATDRLGDPLDFDFISPRMKREVYLDHGMFAFVCWDWVNPFVEWIGDRKVLEIMSGAGWLSKALREKGVNVIATDNLSWWKYHEWTQVTKIEKINAIQAINRYGKDVEILIVSWPDMTPQAYRALRQIRRVNPKCLVVYIGEYDGCTADDNFFDHFYEIEDDLLFNKAAKKFKAWPGLRDYLRLGQYKNKFI